MDCPSLEILIQYADGEMDEINEYIDHIQTCDACRQRIDNLRNIDSLLSIAAIDSKQSITEVTDECIDSNDMSLLVSGALSDDEKGRIEKHILGCQHCIINIFRSLKVVNRVARTNFSEVPDDFQMPEDTNAILRKKLREPSKEKVGRITLSEDSESLQLEERSKNVWLVDSEEPPMMLDLITENGKIRAVLEWLEHGFMSVKIILIEPIKDQIQVILSDYDTKKKLVSRNTDDKGCVEFSRLAMKNYIINLPEIDVSLEILIKE